MFLLELVVAFCVGFLAVNFGVACRNPSKHRLHFHTLLYEYIVEDHAHLSSFVTHMSI